MKTMIKAKKDLDIVVDFYESHGISVETGSYYSNSLEWNDEIKAYGEVETGYWIKIPALTMDFMFEDYEEE